MTKCESCSEDHDGSYGSGRFCSSTCARSFSTKTNRVEINKKVSESLKGTTHSDERKAKQSERQRGRTLPDDWKENISKSIKVHIAIHGHHRQQISPPSSLKDLSKRTVTKIVKRLGIGCSRCGWNEAVGDIHHITPRSKGGTDEHTNLTYICPNCHRLAHANKLITFVSLNEQIGDRWLDYYYPERAGIQKERT